MQVDEILIIGIIIGAGIIFSLFNFFRQFFLSPAYGFAGATDSGQARGNNMVFFFLFLFSIVGMVKYTTFKQTTIPQAPSSTKIPKVEKQQLVTNPTPIERKGKNKSHGQASNQNDPSRYFNTSPGINSIKVNRTRNIEKQEVVLPIQVEPEKENLFFLQVSAYGMERFASAYAEKLVEQFPNNSINLLWDSHSQRTKVLIGGFYSEKEVRRFRTAAGQKIKKKAFALELSINDILSLQPVQ